MINIIEYQNFSISFKGKKDIKIIENINLKIKKGEILGLVGESGCGKTVTAMSLVQLVNKDIIKKQEGKILYNGVDISTFDEKQMAVIRGNNIASIYQDPLTSLNPVYKVGQQVIEGILKYRKISKKEAVSIAKTMLKKVGINDVDTVFNIYPNELSGGMRQRVIIAMALILEPEVLIADEPTTALDVTVQAQILELLKSIKDEFNMTIIIITHDLGVVAELCDRVAIMYAGKVVEVSDVFELFDNPLHPYTKALLDSRPLIDDNEIVGIQKLKPIQGHIIDPTDKEMFCYYYERCKNKTDVCKNDIPQLVDITKNKKVACFNCVRRE